MYPQEPDNNELKWDEVKDMGLEPVPAGLVDDCSEINES